MAGASLRTSGTAASARLPVASIPVWRLLGFLS